MPARARDLVSVLDGQGRQDGDRLWRLRRAGDLFHRSRRAHRREVRRAPRPRHHPLAGGAGERRWPVTLAAFALSVLLAAATPPPPATTSRPGDAPRGQPLSGKLLDERTDEVGALLRCPVCQGLSVADSPATMARNMKAEVREKLAAGYDREQILSDFERSYGEFVRLEPPMRGVNWLGLFGPAGGVPSRGARGARGPRAGHRPRAAAS